MSDTMIDSEARAKIAEVSAVLWGDDRTRDNGVRSVVKAHEERLRVLEEHDIEIESRLQHYLDAEREETCLGLAALAKHEAAEGQLYEEGQEEDANMKIAAMQNGTEVKKAKWQVIAALVTAAFLFAGQVVTAAQASATQRDLVTLTHTLEAQK